VKVSLLYVEGCPNLHLADGRLRQALDRVGRGDVTVEYRAVTTPEEAEAWEFRGSPTVLVDGQDLFADPGAAVGLCCRVYRTEDGLTGSPTVEQLISALQQPGDR
jgi:hypothetical protein